MKSEKASGNDGISSEIYKAGGGQLMCRLTHLSIAIGEKEQVLQDFKDAQTGHIHKRKGDHACADRMALAVPACNLLATGE